LKDSDENEGSASEDEDPALGVVGSLLEGVEKGVSLLNPWNWWTSTAPTESSDVIKCVHINWYGRRLRRNFRFTAEDFCRLHPESGDIRAVHKYSEISCLTVQPNCLIIHYNPGHGEADWIESSTKNLHYMIQTIRSHVPDLIVEEEAAT